MLVNALAIALVADLAMLVTTAGSRVAASAPLGHLYARAREARAHMPADEIVEIADEPYAGTAADKFKAEAEARKVKIEARKWTAGKYNRLLYGDEPQKHEGPSPMPRDAGKTRMRILDAAYGREGTIKPRFIPQNEIEKLADLVEALYPDDSERAAFGLESH